MYKLIDFKATNIIGFQSGLMKKKFHLDLRDFVNKNVMVIIGDNATGKSTFLSMVHPSHLPTDGRTKFVIPGKEGTLVRIYRGDDGTLITSTCIYSPKSDGTHSPKCYLTIQHHEKDEPVELNPNGNVKSYNDLLYTYFGISKDYLSFASYSDAVDDIVTMTDMERKNNVAPLIPNTKRFEIAFNLVNDKYRDLRNLIRNVSQKILAIRDEESLISDMNRIGKQLESARHDREEYIKKLSKAEGRVKELSHGNDMNDMIKHYNTMISAIMEIDAHIMQIQSRLIGAYRELDITPDEDGITFDGMDRIDSQIRKYENKIGSLAAKREQSERRINSLSNELSDIEKQITENQSVLFSIQTRDIRELQQSKDEYLKTLEKMRYTKNKQLYENMTYDEIVSFIRSVSMLDHMIQALYDEYGELVSQYILKSRDDYPKKEDAEILSASLQSRNSKKDSIYRALIEKEQYRKFKDILAQRPTNCHIDTCPFIANALKWESISKDIDQLREDYHSINIEIGNIEAQLQQYDQIGQLYHSLNSLDQYLAPLSDLFERYLHITLKDVKASIQNATWTSVLNIIQLKDLAAILSEKELYDRITLQLLPEVEHAIEISKVYGSNRDLIQSQIDRLNDNREMVLLELDQTKMHRQVSDKMIYHYQHKLDLWQIVADQLMEYQTALKSKVDTSELANEQKEEIDTIRELVEKCKKFNRKLDDATLEIEELEPQHRKLEMDLKTLMQLKDEKLRIEQDFLIVDVIRSILQPGRGIRKELINIYMYDIYQIANQLLLNTFNGKLYLKEFIITDKEFIIPYVYNGAEASDIAYASSSQQSTIAMALSLAIISKLVDKYGIIAIDEADRTLSAENKAIFTDILTKQLSYIGITQAFIISHSPEYYEGYDTGFICFPGYDKSIVRTNDYIEV